MSAIGGKADIVRTGGYVANDRPQVALRPIREETAMNVLDDYLVDPRLSLLDKTRT